MGEKWHMEILAEQTCELPSEEHTNHIKNTKYTKMLIFFGQIMKHRFFTKNWQTQREVFWKRSKTGSIRCT